jgi:hypothetical protein
MAQISEDRSLLLITDVKPEETKMSTTTTPVQYTACEKNIAGTGNFNTRLCYTNGTGISPQKVVVGLCVTDRRELYVRERYVAYWIHERNARDASAKAMWAKHFNSRYLRHTTGGRSDNNIPASVETFVGTTTASTETFKQKDAGTQVVTQIAILYKYFGLLYLDIHPGNIVVGDHDQYHHVVDLGSCVRVPPAEVENSYIHIMPIKTSAYYWDPTINVTTETLPKIVAWCVARDMVGIPWENEDWDGLLADARYTPYSETPKNSVSLSTLGVIKKNVIDTAILISLPELVKTFQSVLTAQSD